MRIVGWRRILLIKLLVRALPSFSLADLSRRGTQIVTQIVTQIICFVKTYRQYMG